MPTRKSIPSPEQHGDLFAPFQARAAELGLSVEEFVTQRLARLRETQPELYAELTDKVASASLHAIPIYRDLSASLQHLEFAAQESNNTKVQRRVRDLRQYLNFDQELAAAALLGSDKENRLPV